MPENGSKTSTVPFVRATFGSFFCAIQMISCRDWWSWTIPGYITMTRRQSNNQWSGGIVAYHTPNIPSAKFRWKCSRLDILVSRRRPPHWLSSKGPNYQRGVLLISSGATKARFEGKAPQEVHQKGLVLAWQCPGSPGTCNPEETGLPVLPGFFWYKHIVFRLKHEMNIYMYVQGRVI